MHITKVISYDITFDDSVRGWDITMYTTISKQNTPESKVSTCEFSVRTLDNVLERGIQVLENATNRYFSDPTSPCTERIADEQNKGNENRPT